MYTGTQHLKSLPTRLFRFSTYLRLGRTFGTFGNIRVLLICFIVYVTDKGLWSKNYGCEVVFHEMKSGPIHQYAGILTCLLYVLLSRVSLVVSLVIAVNGRQPGDE